MDERNRNFTQTLLLCFILVIVIGFDRGFCSDSTASMHQPDTLPAGTPAPALPLPERLQHNFMTMWQSASLPFCVNSIGITDTDGDSRNEIVVVCPKEIRMYRKRDSAFQFIKSFNTPGDRINVRVEIGDLNRNNQPDLCITALSNSLASLQSYICEISGNELHYLVKKAPYFFSLSRQETNHGSPDLFGQKIPEKRTFKGQFFQLAINGRNFSHTKIGTLPGNLIVLSAATRRLNGSFAGFTTAGNLTFFSKSTGELLRETGVTGGEMSLYMTFPSEDDPRIREKIYLPFRPIVFDADDNGLDELLIVKNTDLLRGSFNNTRKLASSEITIFTIRQSNLAPVWSSGTLEYQIRDLCIGDIDSDGIIDCTYVIIHKEGSFFGTEAQSRLTSFQM
ncbi:MAG: VCBS repeat-containing protein [Chitinivibrionales bacterium]|nr:VCBS repeat-containing protein [Chitinivibrionales bacterium]